MGGSKPGERRGGRQKGTPNRRTTERMLIAEARARADGVPLAREILESGMLQYVQLANQCAPPEHGKWSAKKRKLFERYRLAADVRAKWLMPFQSPQYRSITVQAPPTGAARGTPAIDALESFVLTLARARRVSQPELKTIESTVLDATPAEPAKVNHEQ
jgi:hypothetical protein